MFIVRLVLNVRKNSKININRKPFFNRIFNGNSLECYQTKKDTYEKYLDKV